MHFRDTQEMIRFFRSKPEDLRETEKRKQQEADEESGEKAERRREDGEIL